MGKDKEIRILTAPVEIRAGNDGQSDYIDGYALKFERWSDVLGFWMPFQEIISRSALDGADLSNVVALWNHDPNYPMARNTVASDVGSLSLQVDAIGLRFQFTPTDTSYSKDILSNVRAGVVNQCSFAFSLADAENADEWTYDDANDMYQRRINQLGKIYDVSIVTSPAYPDTEAVVGQRSKEKVERLMDERKRPPVSQEKDKLMLELDLLEL